MAACYRGYEAGVGARAAGVLEGEILSAMELTCGTEARETRGDNERTSSQRERAAWQAQVSSPGQPVQLAGKHPMLQLQRSSFSRAPGGCARVAAGQDGRQASPAWCRGHGGPKRRHWSRPRRATRGRGIKYRQRGFLYTPSLSPHSSREGLKHVTNGALSSLRAQSLPTCSGRRTLF